ncbi:hypothetical protein FOZ63_031600 [Perkinsus olseni]|uniref:Uncharacterized protein n=1 Tax=Perkinsus olseni TaxID=32597 RepID=A0A7J6RC71_PEROL|nr:hypothetical protein FOZ63_031600 [Perkinsus olseni]
MTSTFHYRLHRFGCLNVFFLVCLVRAVWAKGGNKGVRSQRSTTAAPTGGLEVQVNVMDMAPWVTAKIEGSYHTEFAAGDHKFRWSLQQHSARTVFNGSSEGVRIGLDSNVVGYFPGLRQASTGWYSFSGYADSRGMRLHASSVSTVRDNDGGFMTGQILSVEKVGRGWMFLVAGWVQNKPESDKKFYHAEYIARGVLHA